MRCFGDICNYVFAGGFRVRHAVRLYDTLQIPFSFLRSQEHFMALLGKIGLPTGVRGLCEEDGNEGLVCSLSFPRHFSLFLLQFDFNVCGL